MAEMIESSLEHVVIAVMIQLILIYWLGVWGSGAVAVAIFLGREIAQNEYKLALIRGWEWGETPPVKWHEGLTTGWGGQWVAGCFAAGSCLCCCGHAVEKISPLKR
ncbi:MAG: hypothetical protein L0J54_03945 [Halomonas sp.]|nr:hypothetical protein [Halomonas sp.]MDN6297165.1 hypothetical protein [Halomonas sp.]MDN6314333.1 hypothetical protein [Halomonas sp.]MDN6335899.1 hypothetical protein [Halomonas sp.]